MGTRLMIFGALLVTTFLFEQYESKVIHEDKGAVTFGNGRFGLDDNLIAQGSVDSCTTYGDVWECCVGFESGLNMTVCVSVEYLRDDPGLELKVTYNGRIIIQEKLSARDPPPLCISVPYCDKIAHICISAYDLEVKDKRFTGCVELEIRIITVKTYNFKLKCFDIPIGFFTSKSRYEVGLMKNNLV